MKLTPTMQKVIAQGGQLMRTAFFIALLAAVCGCNTGNPKDDIARLNRETDARNEGYREGLKDGEALAIRRAIESDKTLQENWHKIDEVYGVVRYWGEYCTVTAPGHPLRRVTFGSKRVQDKAKEADIGYGSKPALVTMIQPRPYDDFVLLDVTFAQLGPMPHMEKKK